MKNFENLVYSKKRLTLDISLCREFCSLMVFLIALICVIKLLIFSISCLSSSLSIISIYFDNKILSVSDVAELMIALREYLREVKFISLCAVRKFESILSSTNG